MFYEHVDTAVIGGESLPRKNANGGAGAPHR